MKKENGKKKTTIKKVCLGGMDLEDIREQNLNILEKFIYNADSSSCGDPGGGHTGGGGA